jgi:hypothetical protein
MPHQKNGANKKHLKHYKLIECIINHFIGASNSLDTDKVVLPLNISFYRQNAVGSNVSDNLFAEAWRFFLDSHSLWEFGPRGYYMTNGRTPCEGCSDKFCHFASEIKCMAIGRWLANTLFRPTGVPVPLPLDPVFVQIVTQTVHLFEGFTQDEADEEADRLLEGRETFLWKITEGFFSADETNMSLKDVSVPLLVSWLCKPAPINRAELKSHWEIILPPDGDVSCYEWFIEWFDNCTEMQLRWFLFEVLGTPVPRPNNTNRFTINITPFYSEDGTSSDICQNIINLPSVSEKELFFTILNFRGSFLINK